MLSKTTIGRYRLGLALVNEPARVDASRAKRPVPAPVWRWQVRELGADWDGSRSISVSPGVNVAHPDLLAQAMRMLQAAATSDPS